MLAHSYLVCALTVWPSNHIYLAVEYTTEPANTAIDLTDFIRAIEK